MASSSLTCTKLTLYTITAIILQMIGLILFVLGFFPVKPTLFGASGVESYYPPENDSIEHHNVTDLSPDQLKSLYQKLSGIPPLYDRLILMVIDGLPAEFVLGKDKAGPPKAFHEAMPYTQSLLAEKRAIGYHAKAAPPTVTMPRLKAMVSGAIGGFLDVAMNFNTQALLDDNLIGQFFKIGWKIVMLGDDTWLKLFPGMFTRHDGVNSFFVKDTVQVDYNVTRHLNNELHNTDWNLLILHYLGLDHVGHLGGRKSNLMKPKLKEMDQIIQMIDQKKDERTLLVRAGFFSVSDHGMTENGNHGGSSYEETDSLALFIGQEKFNHVSNSYNTVNQVDITPTLALLFGVPIPKNNVGFVMLEPFKSLTDDEQLRLLQLNSWQLMRLLQVQLPNLKCKTFTCDKSIITEQDSNFEKISCCSYLKAESVNFSSNDSHKAFLAYRNFLKSSSEWLARKTTDKPAILLGSGLSIMFLSCLILIKLLFMINYQVYFTKDYKFFESFDEYFIIVIVLILILSMGSSSTVEEEQYVWYFLTSTILIIFLRKTLQSSKGKKVKVYLITILIIGRIIRGWHQGGINWVTLPDISKWLDYKGNSYIKLLRIISGTMIISVGLFNLRVKKLFTRVVSMIYLILGLMVMYHIIIYQDNNNNLSSNFDATILAQRIYACFSICTIGTWFIPFFSNINRDLITEFKDCLYIIGWGYIYSWSLLQLLLQQSINSVPVLLLFLQVLLVLWCFSSRNLHHKQWVEVAALYCLGMVGHFGLGNTNSLATIDVAGAFIGVSSYSTLLSGILMFIITYASPMLTLLSIVMYISIKNTDNLVKFKDEKVNFSEYLVIIAGLPCLVPLVFNSILLIGYTIVLLLMRNHLFIWSVFSPKYLYVCATTVCVCIGVTMVGLSVLLTFMGLVLRVKFQANRRIELR